LPNPFSKKNKAATPSNDDSNEPIAISNSTLVCEYCFFVSSEGTYYPEKEWLIWDCDACGFTNIVKNIEL